MLICPLPPYPLQALFDPSLADIEGPGISHAAFDAIQAGHLDQAGASGLVGGT